MTAVLAILAKNWKLIAIAAVLAGVYGVGHHRGAVSRDAEVAQAVAQTAQARADQGATELARQKDTLAWTQWRDECNANVERIKADAAEQAAMFARVHSQETAAQRRLRGQIADLEARPIQGLPCEAAVDEAVSRALAIVGGAP